MAFEFPLYLKKANIRSSEIQYPWDDWDVKKAYLPADKDLIARLAPLSSRAVITLTIAISEWLFFRLNELEDDPNPPDFLEAAWAASIDRNYMAYGETDDSDWRGPIRGPMNVAMMMLLELLFIQGESPFPSPHPSWMTNLVELVLPDSSEFRRWLEGCITRLSKFFPKPPDDSDDLFAEKNPGSCVPRAVFDLAEEFDPKQAPMMIDRFLQSLDPSDNLFLNEPEEMLEKGFQGTPYRFQGNN